MSLKGILLTWAQKVHRKVITDPDFVHHVFFFPTTLSSPVTIGVLLALYR
jgi:hypothetical protein